MEQILKSETGFLIRPFVRLTGQRDGYKWQRNSNGLWIGFLRSNQKKYGPQITGKLYYLS